MGLFRQCCCNSMVILMFLLGLKIVTLACILISNVVYTVPATIIPILFDVGSASYWLVLSTYSYVSFGVFFNYWMAVGTSPGYVTPDVAARAVEAARREGRPLSTLRTCQTCKLVKPPRTHHCSISGKCVLKMDHFCPWINGAVGYYNQRYFYSFLVYLLIGTLYSLLLISRVCYFHTELEAFRFDKVCSQTRVFFTLVLVIVIFAAMLFFVGWNTHVVATNQTAIEVQINREYSSYGSSNNNPKQQQVSGPNNNSGLINRGSAAVTLWRNPYDIGRWNNFVEVFGGDWSLGFPSVMEVAATLQRCARRLLATCSRNKGSRDNSSYCDGWVTPAHHSTNSCLHSRAAISTKRGGVLGCLWMFSPTFQPMQGDGTWYPTVQPMRSSSSVV